MQWRCMYNVEKLWIVFGKRNQKLEPSNKAVRSYYTFGLISKYARYSVQKQTKLQLTCK